MARIKGTHMQERRRLQDKHMHRYLHRFDAVAKGDPKIADHCMQYFGATIEELRDYIASQFATDMTWENYKDKWILGFEFPPKMFNMQNPMDRGTCFSVTNLKPMPVAH